MLSKISMFDEINKNKRDTVFLMGALFLLVAVLSYGISYITETNPIVCISATILGFLIYMVLIYYSGDSLIVASVGAKKLEKKDSPFIFNVVEGLAIASNIPVPEIYILNDDAPNAFATGRDSKHAKVVLTSGLIKNMNREELEGVLAHEISHIANYDILFMMISIALVSTVFLLSRIILQSLRYGGVSRRNRNNGGGVLLLLIAMSILSPIIALIIRFAISRKREYLADANGAKLTRYPKGLADALKKIKEMNLPTKSSNEFVAPLFFASPKSDFISNLYSTHPPINERIKRLTNMM